MNEIFAIPLWFFCDLWSYFYFYHCSSDSTDFIDDHFLFLCDLSMISDHIVISIIFLAILMISSMIFVIPLRSFCDLWSYFNHYTSDSCDFNDDILVIPLRFFHDSWFLVISWLSLFLKWFLWFYRWFFVIFCDLSSKLT